MIRDWRSPPPDPSPLRRGRRRARQGDRVARDRASACATGSEEALNVAAKLEVAEPEAETSSTSPREEPIPEVIRVLARILVRQALIEAALVLPENDNP